MPREEVSLSARNLRVAGGAHGPECSVDVGADAVGHALAVALPGQPVLLPAVLLVTRLPVHQQADEIDHVEIGQNVIKTCRGTKLT